MSSWSYQLGQSSLCFEGSAVSVRLCDGLNQNALKPPSFRGMSVPFVPLVLGQCHSLKLLEFTLGNGRVLRNVNIAYKTWGKHRVVPGNAVIVCHDLFHDMSVDQWWPELLAAGGVCDPAQYFVVCLCALGSPYGTASPISTTNRRGRTYQSAFPRVSIRDSVRLHRIVLQRMGVRSLELVIGTGMGGMMALEWATCHGSPAFFYQQSANNNLRENAQDGSAEEHGFSMSPTKTKTKTKTIMRTGTTSRVLASIDTQQFLVKRVVIVAAPLKQTAWAAAWNEQQRQAIFTDPWWQGGKYHRGPGFPKEGVATARMTALLLRSSPSALSQYFPNNLSIGKALRVQQEKQKQQNQEKQKTTELTQLDFEKTKVNDGENAMIRAWDERIDSVEAASSFATRILSFGRFCLEFDAGCYVRLTQAMDSHNVNKRLDLITQSVLVIGFSSDSLYPIGEMRRAAATLRNADFAEFETPHGHDAAFLDGPALERRVSEWLETLTAEPKHHHSRL